MPPFADRYQPDYEVTRFVVEKLRSEPVLWNPNDPNDPGLMYVLTPRLVNGDDRIYSAYVELPENSQLRSALPRIHIEARQDGGIAAEQTDVLVPSGMVTIYVNTIVPRTREQLGEQIDAVARRVLLSTLMSNARILGSPLDENVERRQKARESTFGDVWRITSAYRARRVEVIGP